MICSVWVRKQHHRVGTGPTKLPFVDILSSFYVGTDSLQAALTIQDRDLSSV